VLADKLISLHIEDSPYKQLPSYEYEHLKKGITCEKCNSISVSVARTKCFCGECGHQEEVAAAVMRSVKEFKLLFPNQKITTNIIHEWCQVVKFKKTIRKILSKNYDIKGVHQWAFYE